MTRQRTVALCHEQVTRDMIASAFTTPADGLTGLQHARQHRADMTPERRAQLDAEWL